MAYKPILFNTEMVQAIKAGRKTQTRRIIRPQPEKLPEHLLEAGMNIIHKGKLCKLHVPYGYAARTRGELIVKPVKPPCRPGDILWVRETWQHAYTMDDNNQAIEGTGRYIYYADNPMPFDYWVDTDTGEHKEQMPWKPSIHMPKEAARIFLRVKDARIERLRDIGNADAIAEGFSGTPCHHENADPALGCTDCLNTGWLEPPYVEFAQLWDSTIKPADLYKYGWDANPWVWVIEFERTDKPEGW